MALTTFPNGLRLNVSEMPELNTATICIDLVGGFQGESQLLNGSCEMISRLLLCGTKNYNSAIAVTNYAKQQGFVININAYKEFLQVCISCLKNRVELAIMFAFELLFNSNFDESYINIIKNQMKAEIELNKLNPSIYLSTLTNQALFARTGLMNTKLGNIKSIDRITKESLKTLYEKYITPKNMVISVGGAVEEDKIITQISELFYNKLKNTEYKQIKYVSHIENFEGFVNIKKRPYNQSRVEISFPSLSFKDDNKFALDIISRALEQELKERLKNEPYFKSLKIENVCYANNGKLVFGLIVDGEKAETFIEKLLVELKDIVNNNGVSLNDFTAEKNSYITDFVLRSEKSEELTKLCANELVIAKKEFSLNDKFELLASISYKTAMEVLKSVVDFTKINIAYLGEPVALGFLKDIIIG